MMIPVLLRALSLPSSAQRHYHERSGHQRVPLGKSPRARAEGVVGEGDREAATISKFKKREESRRAIQQILVRLEQQQNSELEHYEESCYEIGSNSSRPQNQPLSPTTLPLQQLLFNQSPQMKRS